MQHDYIGHFFQNRYIDRSKIDSKSIHRSIENRYIDRSISIWKKIMPDSFSWPKIDPKWYLTRLYWTIFSKSIIENIDRSISIFDKKNKWPGGICIIYPMIYPSPKSVQWFLQSRIQKIPDPKNPRSLVWSSNQRSGIFCAHTDKQTDRQTHAQSNFLPICVLPLFVPFTELASLTPPTPLGITSHPVLKIWNFRKFGTFN